ncbi:MAG: 4-phosphoerythronate dehydrogenase [Victivallaceae bacterium]|nr:4-phosphoerythronate dehydrogenase [Victivallaceae bacterium]
MKIVVDNKIPFIHGVLEPVAEVVYLPGGSIVAAEVKDADAIITRTRTKCDAELLTGSAVKFIATATIGFDHIDTRFCKNNNIVWTNAPGCNSASVAQYLAATLLNLAVDHNLSLQDKTLGIIGVGNVGRKVAAVGQALGMRVLLNDPPRAEREPDINFVNLEQILSESDFITTHVPLEKSGSYPTCHLADEKFFKAMKSNAYFINSSRGPVCNNMDLKNALQTNMINGAVLDVWENEPGIDLELLNLVNYGTPHIAGYSADGKANGTAISVNIINEFFNLGLDKWYPDDVPLPPQTNIKITCAGKTCEQIILEAVNYSYDIKADWKCLTASPDTFEKQRGDYPLRREPHSYTVKLEQAGINIKKLKSALSMLGFQKHLKRPKKR